MEKTLAVLNDLKKKGVISEYAIGGGMGALFYIEPFLTYDLDIFVMPKDDHELDPLGKIYSYLKRRKYKLEGEQVVIEGVPVQFLPAWNNLLGEAVRKASAIEYQGVPTRVMTIEHLLVIMLDCGRNKDRQRFLKVLAEAQLDRKKLERIVERHGLQVKYASWKRSRC